MEIKDTQLSLGVSCEVQPLADSAQEIKRRHECNRQSWNEAAQYYAEQVAETIEFLRAGNSSLHPIEKRNLGDLREWCHTAVHLQCASGCDTLSLINEGVENVIGIDISDVHIANAVKTTQALGMAARWYCCDLCDIPTELNSCADLVYTGQGAINWLHDLQSWGKVIFRLLKPGGRFHIFDDHPLSWLFKADAETLEPSHIDYFKHAECARGWPDTYIGDLGRPREEQALKFERNWPLSDIFEALHSAGLNIEHLGEYSEQYWNNFPNLKPELRARIPMTFSILARKPSATS